VTALDLPAILDAVESHALASGYVQRFTAAEPSDAPGRGVSAATMLTRVTSLAGRSGLSASAARVELGVRLYVPSATRQPEAVEAVIVAAVDALLRSFSADFDLGGARFVDLLGAHGAPLESVAGWTRMGDQLYRVHTITLPIIVDDLWGQSP
jgi:hypothetical protein